MAHHKTRLTLTSWAQVLAGRSAISAVSAWDGAFLMDNAALWEVPICY